MEHNRRVALSPGSLPLRFFLVKNVEWEKTWGLGKPDVIYMSLEQLILSCAVASLDLCVV